MNLSESSKITFLSELKSSKCEDFEIFLVRQDGLLLYHHHDEKKNVDAQSISVLISGAWSASKELQSRMGSNEEETLRFSFDNSDCGLYILPLKSGKLETFLAMYYEKEANPGFLKQRFRVLKDKLQEKIEVSSVKVKSGFLFKDISDEEMDRLFSFGGK